VSKYRRWIPGSMADVLLKPHNDPRGVIMRGLPNKAKTHSPYLFLCKRSCVNTVFLEEIVKNKRNEKKNNSLYS
jgi:hypothetical protein